MRRYIRSRNVQRELLPLLRHLHEQELSGDINVGFGVSLELHLSNNTLVCGAVGPCNAVVAQPPAQGSTAAPTSRLCSPNAVGAADTTQWRVSALDKSATIAFVLDTEVMDAGSSSSTVATEIIPSAKRFVQFITKYTTVEGEERIRVTSVSQSIAPNSQQFFQNNQLFDQACAASVISRFCVEFRAAGQSLGCHSPMARSSAR